MKKIHDISSLKIEGEFLYLTIDGVDRKLILAEISSALSNASETDRNTFEISPSGYGIHWPLLDEDISVDGLLGIKHTPVWKKKIA